MSEPVRKIRVMVVDDSAVIRGFFINMLESSPMIEVVASAGNGEIALNVLKRQGEHRVEVDVLTLDIEMPVMDGLTALPEILKLSPKTRVILASSLSQDGAAETVKGLSLGAADYIPKPSKPQDREAMYKFSRKLLAKVKILAGQPVSEEPEEEEAPAAPVPAAPATPASAPRPAPIAPAAPSGITKMPRTEDVVLRPAPTVQKVPEAIAIGCSTGGPQALNTLFRALKGRKFKVPVFITQHMPPHFTTMLANQLQEVSGIPSAEGQEGDIVEPGRIYLAPGDFHMLVRRSASTVGIYLNKGPQENFCRPAVDPMLRSLTEAYGDRLLVLIMTGMGADGMLGCKQVVEKGGTVFAQDKATSIVWGMPGAVATAGLCTQVLPLAELPNALIHMAQGQIV